MAQSRNPTDVMSNKPAASIGFPPDIVNLNPRFCINLREYSVLGGSASGSTYINLPLPTSGLIDNFPIKYEDFSFGALGGVAASVTDLVQNGGSLSQKLNQGMVGLARIGGQALAEGIGDAIAGKEGGEFAAAGVSIATGTVMNPNYGVLFKGVEPRKFNFSWMLTARSRQEADAIVNIVKTIKRKALPAINTSSPNYILNYPSIAYISTPGSELLTFSKQGTFIENVSINFNGSADYVALFKDTNRPVQVALTLSFRERGIITADDIQ